MFTFLVKWFRLNCFCVLTKIRRCRSALPGTHLPCVFAWQFFQYYAIEERYKIAAVGFARHDGKSEPTLHLGLEKRTEAVKYRPNTASVQHFDTHWRRTELSIVIGFHELLRCIDKTNSETRVAAHTLWHNMHFGWSRARFKSARKRMALATSSMPMMVWLLLYMDLFLSNHLFSFGLRDNTCRLQFLFALTHDSVFILIFESTWDIRSRAGRCASR